jgi:hypothetical protein
VSDRELLELAAKAAGIVYRHDNSFWTHEDYCAFWSYDDLCNCGARWNPLTDDGDALRLAVKLGLHISQQLSYVAVMQPHGGAGSHLLQWIEKYNNDPYAATRRVITRAAAEIGRNMK